MSLDAVASVAVGNVLELLARFCAGDGVVDGLRTICWKL
jgi:hypothetical protein